MIAAAIYVFIAAGVSLGPIRNAIDEAQSFKPPPPPRAASTSGPIPEAPATASVKIAKALAKQAAIVFGPPALALWFGWDVWFAVTGFFPSRRKTVED